MNAKLSFSSLTESPSVNPCDGEQILKLPVVGEYVVPSGAAIVIVGADV